MMANDCRNLCADVRACDVHAECCGAQCGFVYDSNEWRQRGRGRARVCAATKTARTVAPSILCLEHSRASLFWLPALPDSRKKQKKGAYTLRAALVHSAHLIPLFLCACMCVCVRVGALREEGGGSGGGRVGGGAAVHDGAAEIGRGERRELRGRLCVCVCVCTRLLSLCPPPPCFGFVSQTSIRKDAHMEWQDFRMQGKK